MTKKLPSAKDFMNRELKDWNVTTCHSYLAHKSLQHYNLPYLPGAGGWRPEQKLIKVFLETHGAELFKGLIDQAYMEYKPTAQYPSLNFMFIHTYMAPRILPRLLKVQQNRATLKEQYKLDTEIQDDWI